MASQVQPSSYERSLPTQLLIGFLSQLYPVQNTEEGKAGIAMCQANHGRGLDSWL
jgi:hypothetical protein